MMLGRLLGLSAILLQIAVFLQPLLPEKHSVFSVCKTVAAALHLEVTNVLPHHSFATSHPHSNQASGADQNPAHVFTHVQDRHEHQERDDAHTGHDCQFCLVHSYTLPLLDTKLRLVLIRTQTLLQFFSTFVPYTLSLPHPWFLIPQGRAPPLTLIH